MMICVVEVKGRGIAAFNAENGPRPLRLECAIVSFATISWCWRPMAYLCGMA
jgi:hypothetical protein